MFIMRRRCIEELTLDWPPGSFLEAGAGTGIVTTAFLEREFTGTCFDIGEESRAVLRRNLGSYGDRVCITGDLDTVPTQEFQYLFAFEVLEHIEDDLGALLRWSRHLEPGGRLLVSVPAHRRYHSVDDDAMGHVRRYERIELGDLLTRAGYTSIDIVSYGYPLGVWARHATRALFRLRLLRAPTGRNALERTIDSGVKRFPLTERLSPIFHPWLLAPFAALQRRYYATDRGVGYVATGVLGETPP